MKNIFKNDLKILALPVGILVAILILLVISVKILFDNISKLNNDIATNAKEESMLQTKLSSLQEITPQVSTQSQQVLLALPDTNSVLPGIAQIKNQASRATLVIGILNSSNTANLVVGPLNSSVTDFSATGNYKNIATFIESIKKSAPILRFSAIKIENMHSVDNSVYTLTASIFNYWAPLPTTFPAIDQPLQNLTSDEQKTLNEVTALDVFPVSIQSSTPSAVIGKTNPFQ